MEQTITTTT